MTQVIPGDSVPEAAQYGPGIFDGRAVVAGNVKQANDSVFLDTNYKRYVPAARDLVIGKILQRGEYYRVSLQPYSRPVRLHHLAFENATRKNRPHLEIGDVVYARVSSAERDLEAEIECFDPTTKKAAGFGPLKQGNIIDVRLGYARQLLFGNHPILEQIGEKYAYEMAIGMNGKVWIKGPDVKTTLQICEWIKSGDNTNQA